MTKEIPMTNDELCHCAMLDHSSFELRHSLDMRISDLELSLLRLLAKEDEVDIEEEEEDLDVNSVFSKLKTVKS